MTLPNWLKQHWEAAFLALIAAFVLELLINVFAGTTVWHRLGNLEHSVQQLEHQRELEELRMNSQFNELRQKAETNAEQVEKVEQKVEKKKEHKP